MGHNSKTGLNKACIYDLFLIFGHDVKLAHLDLPCAKILHFGKKKCPNILTCNNYKNHSANLRWIIVCFSHTKLCVFKTLVFMAVTVRMFQIHICAVSNWHIHFSFIFYNHVGISDSHPVVYQSNNINNGSYNQHNNSNYITISFFISQKLQILLVI